MKIDIQPTTPIDLYVKEQVAALKLASWVGSEVSAAWSGISKMTNASDLPGGGGGISVPKDNVHSTDGKIGIVGGTKDGPKGPEFPIDKSNTTPATKGVENVSGTKPGQEGSPEDTYKKPPETEKPLLKAGLPESASDIRVTNLKGRKHDSDSSDDEPKELTFGKLPGLDM
ncbi:MAG TPA: hypothetical protein V6C76_18005 [Drouetiella sp.]